MRIRQRFMHCRSSMPSDTFILYVLRTVVPHTLRNGGSTPKHVLVCVQHLLAKIALLLRQKLRNIVSLSGWNRRYCAIKKSWCSPARTIISWECSTPSRMSYGRGQQEHSCERQKAAFVTRQPRPL